MRRGHLFSILAAFGLLAAATGAQASTGGNTSVAVQPGATGPSVGAVTPGAFSAVTLNGQDQAIYASLGSYEVTDATGSGAGWKVTFQASRFACTAGTDKCPAGTGDTLAAGLLKVAKPTAACATGNGCQGRAAAPTGGISTATAIDGSSAVTVLSAAAGSGMGKYTVTPGAFNSDPNKNLELQLPAYAYAATYTSTLTIDISTGP